MCLTKVITVVIVKNLKEGSDLLWWYSGKCRYFEHSFEYFVALLQLLVFRHHKCSVDFKCVCQALLSLNVLLLADHQVITCTGSGTLWGFNFTVILNVLMSRPAWQILPRCTKIIQHKKHHKGSVHSGLWTDNNYMLYIVNNYLQGGKTNLHFRSDRFHLTLDPFLFSLSCLL